MEPEDDDAAVPAYIRERDPAMDSRGGSRRRRSPLFQSSLGPDELLVGGLPSISPCRTCGTFGCDDCGLSDGESDVARICPTSGLHVPVTVWRFCSTNQLFCCCLIARVEAVAAASSDFPASLFWLLNSGRNSAVLLSPWSTCERFSYGQSSRTRTFCFESLGLEHCSAPQ